ncbi:MAG: hypothetical protein WDZ27_04755 [Waddliaceae bacterium]
MKWTIIDSGKGTATENMAHDYALLSQLSSMTGPTLRFYEWHTPSVTHGYFMEPASWIQESKLDSAKRPTGGGILFHGHDFTFSVVIPKSFPAYTLNTVENYRYVNQLVMNALNSLGTFDLSLSSSKSPNLTYCMIRPTIGDIMMDGKKLAGGAQRRTRHGFLHQGSVNLFPIPQSGMEEQYELFLEMHAQSTFLFSENNDKAREEFKRHLAFSFQRC